MASNADIEIRMYMPYNNLLRFYSIQYKGGQIRTCSFIAQIFYGTPYNFTIAPGYVKMLRSLTKVKGDFAKQNVVCLAGYHPVSCLCNHDAVTDSLWKELVQNGVFTLPDIATVLADLNQQNRTYNEPPYFEDIMSSVIEAKMYNQYRNFRVAPGYFTYNKTIEACKNGYQLARIIQDIVSYAKMHGCKSAAYL